MRFILVEKQSVTCYRLKIMKPGIEISTDGFFFFKLSVEHMHEYTAEKSSSVSEGLVWRLEISSQAEPSRQTGEMTA